MQTNMWSRWLICGLCGLALLLAAGCATVPDWYTVTGTGAADNSGLSSSQRRLMAREAAKVDARRQLLEAAKGLQIDSRTTVRDFITQSDEINARLTGIIRGAQITDERVLNDGTVEVDMRLDMNRVKHLVH